MKILSKSEWLTENWLIEYDRTEEEKEEDYQCYVERASIENIMFPNENDDYWMDNQ